MKRAGVRIKRWDECKKYYGRGLTVYSGWEANWRKFQCFVFMDNGENHMNINKMFEGQLIYRGWRWSEERICSRILMFADATFVTSSIP